MHTPLQLLAACTAGGTKICAETSGIPVGGADSLLANALNLTYFLAAAVAVIIIVVAGVMYSTSSGDAGRITKAKNLLTYAIVGLVVVLSAFIITAFVIGRFK